MHHAHPHACMLMKNEICSAPLYDSICLSTCLFILKKYQLLILSFMTLADKKVERRKWKKRMMIIGNRIKAICSKTALGEHNKHDV